MHTLYKSVDKNNIQIFSNITEAKRGVNPVRNKLNKNIITQFLTGSTKNLTAREMYVTIHKNQENRFHKL